MTIDKVKVPAAFIFVASGIYFMAFHWNRFVSDFWPPDKATVAPNILASVIQYGIIIVLMYLLYPPFRRAIDKWVTNHLASVKQAAAAEHKKTQAILAHVIKHSPDIPNFVHGVGDVTSLPAAPSAVPQGPTAQTDAASDAAGSSGAPASGEPDVH